MLSLNSNDKKKTWNTINEILNRKPKSVNHLKKIFNGTDYVYNGKDIAETLNQYFSNAPRDIANSLPDRPDLDFRRFLTGNYLNSFYLRPVNSARVVNLFKTIKSTCGGGSLCIPGRVVQVIINLIAHPLAVIFNKCISNGYFPDSLKIAEVVPIFKAGDPTLPSNFRPISVLTIFSKVFERHIHTELTNYFDSLDIINAEQFGFRRGVSTNEAIAKFLKYIYSGLNENNYNMGIFLDLQKAFDLVNCDILLSKLNHYGIRGTPLKLLKSFLNNRSQYVKIDGFRSSSSQVTLGTPQGSILSPLLFIIFINDLVNCSSSLYII